MRLIRAFVIFGLVFLGDLVSALRLSLQGRQTSFGPSSPPLRRRGNVSGTSPLNNSADVSYYTNITLGGAPFTVLIDTGSSDLWVAGSVPGGKSTGKSSGVNYAVGSVKGPVKTAALEFAGYTVPDQAYLEVTPDHENPEGTGLIGLGPNSGSNVYQALNSPAGLAVLDRIFLQNLTTPNYLTVLLGRSEDPTDLFPGDLTVGETLPDYQNITDQPKLAVTDVPVYDVGDQHFQVLLDADGLIGPDGKVISIKTAVSGTSNQKQATAVIDTGFSLSQVPKSVADAIYGKISGAEYANVTGVGSTWIVPCNQEVNITFKFSGISYPIHPLDTTLDPSLVGLKNIKNSQGQASCIGTYQPVSFNPSSKNNFDMILGMSFLRNAYTLINFGDFVAGSTNKGDPYIQFLSTTDPSEAHSDFVNVRLDGTDTTKGNNDNSPADTPGNDDDNSSDSRRKTYYIIAASLGAAAVFLLIAAFFLNRSRKNRHGKGTAMPGAAWGSYQPLHEPAPAPAIDMHVMNSGPQYNQYNPNNQYQNQYNPTTQYQNPWDHRH